MNNFLRTKFRRVADQAKYQGVNPVAYLVKKLVTKAWFYIFGFVDLMLIILNLPIYVSLVFVRILIGYKKTNAIIFTGLEHVIKKTEDRAILFQKKGFRVFYHTTEDSPIPSLPHLTDFIKVHTRLSFVNIYLFLADVWNKRPCYVEIYMEVKIMQLVTEVLLCRMLRVPTVVIERGMCLNIEIGNSDMFFRFWFEQLLKVCDRIYYREPYLLNHLKKMKLRESKLFFDHNKIPLAPEPEFKKNNRTILFLNSFIPARRVDIYAEAVAIITKKYNDAIFLLVGFRSAEERMYAESLLAAQNVLDKVEIHPYSRDVSQFWERSSIFVFPADFVFANFSLLESMERKLVPIVADVRDAWRIVDHGVNGFLVAQNGQAFAERIMQLLDDADLKKRMATAAREKIKTTFNDEHRIDSIDEFIKSRAGRQLSFNAAASNEKRADQPKTFQQVNQV